MDQTIKKISDGSINGPSLYREMKKLLPKQTTDLEA